MFRKKKDFDDEPHEISDFYKFLIVVAAAAIMLFGASKFTDYIYEKDMEIQYQNEYVFVQE